MKRDIAGAWRLDTWRKLATDGSVSYPFGEQPVGTLLYTPDGYMAVQMLVAERPRLATDDALGGSVEERASAYSSCLAYFGRYEVKGESVIHHVTGSLFPNWSQTTQERPFVCRGDELCLQVKDSSGRVTNEIIWRREGICC
jgi:hypothetical protein